jgi:hypothetical protein
MKLNSQDLEKIADLTLGYYNRYAEDFWEGTRNHDVSQNIAARQTNSRGGRAAPDQRPPSRVMLEIVIIRRNALCNCLCGER